VSIADPSHSKAMLLSATISTVPAWSGEAKTKARLPYVGRIRIGVPDSSSSICPTSSDRAGITGQTIAAIPRLGTMVCLEHDSVSIRLCVSFRYAHGGALAVPVMSLEGRCNHGTLAAPHHHAPHGWVDYRGLLRRVDFSHESDL
jgi:hypothetical protein